MTKLISIRKKLIQLKLQKSTTILLNYALVVYSACDVIQILDYRKNVNLHQWFLTGVPWS